MNLNLMIFEIEVKIKRLCELHSASLLQCVFLSFLLGVMSVLCCPVAFCFHGHCHCTKCTSPSTFSFNQEQLTVCTIPPENGQSDSMFTTTHLSDHVQDHMTSRLHQPQRVGALRSHHPRCDCTLVGPGQYPRYTSAAKTGGHG